MTREEKLGIIIDGIENLDNVAMETARKKWNSIAKPLHSLGKLEEHIIRIAGITGNAEVELKNRALIAMCADNGVVEEGVTQTGQEVTAIVAENFLEGATSAAIMCQSAEVDLFPIDIGMVRDTRVPNYKVAYGTKNMVKEPAMTREEALQGNPDRSASCERGKKKQDIRYLRPERWESVIQRLAVQWRVSF